MKAHDRIIYERKKCVALKGTQKKKVADNASTNPIVKPHAATKRARPLFNEVRLAIVEAFNMRRGSFAFVNQRGP